MAAKILMVFAVEAVLLAEVFTMEVDAAGPPKAVPGGDEDELEEGGPGGSGSVWFTEVFRRGDAGVTTKLETI
jgi:hypothetical protein